MIRLGLLQCDSLDPPYAAIDGDYPELYRALLTDDDVELVTYRAHRGELPGSTADCDAWLVSGSRFGVGDGLDWEFPLAAFVDDLIDRRRPLVGICFGHQLIAQRLGATVARAEQGWNIGGVEYRLHDDPPGGSPQRTFVIAASHRDQVLELPAGARLLASAPRCPIAGFTTDSVLTIQGHPEFTPALSTAIYRNRVDRLGREAVDAAVASLEVPLDSARVAAWISVFLRDRCGADDVIDG